MVGLVDAALPKLPSEIASLVDDVSYSVNPCTLRAPAIFIDGTPMTHDPRFGLRFQNHPAFFRVAVIYDFIPLDWPGYLPTVASRIDYLSKLARLKRFDLFCPISEYSAWRLSELLGVPPQRVCVTGASVRLAIYKLRDRIGSVPSPYAKEEPYFLIVVGPDVRKNPEVVVKALRNLNLVYDRRIPLKIAGHYDEACERDLRKLAGGTKGSGFLEFCPNIPDEELVSLLAGAIATIAPSHVEGFSLPIAEASVCGCPAIASTCAAHLELIDAPEALFQSDDSAALADKLDALLHDPALRSSLVTSQAHLGAKFHEEAVGRRFWNSIEVAIGPSMNGAVYTRGRKPRLAFLSPYPPDQSGAARYTAMTMRAGEKLFESDLFTDAARPFTFEGSFRDAGGISVASLLDRRYDAIVSVLGDSGYHNSILEFFERYGGPCILHDARLTSTYIQRLGQDRILTLAASFLGRSVTAEEVWSWSQDRNPPTLFLEPIIERASPLIVHTATQQAQIWKRYGVKAEVIACCPTYFFDNHELTALARQAARERLGLSPANFLVSSFGIVAPEKGMDTCVLAVELLRSWKIPAELYFVGGAGPHKAAVDRLSALFGIKEHVHCPTDFVEEANYRDFLIASDAGLQLRTYGFGQFSASLADCVSAGIASVASSDLAKSCDAPEYVSTVPDTFSPLQVAEQLALIWERQAGRGSHQGARGAYLETHNFDCYAKRLIEILGVA